MKEALMATIILFAFLIVMPVTMHKALYLFAKVTYRVHKTRTNAKKYERFERILRRRMIANA